MHKTFYYARVSTREQNLDRQLEPFARSAQMIEKSSRIRSPAKP